MEKVSITRKQTKIKLLGHIIRAHRHDPLRQVWVSETMKNSECALGQPISQNLGDENIQMICEAAKNRKEPLTNQLPVTTITLSIPKEVCDPQPSGFLTM